MKQDKMARNQNRTLRQRLGALVLGAMMAVLGAALWFSPVHTQEGDGLGEGDITVDIRGAVRRTLIPIALPPIRAMGGGDAEVSREIMTTLRRDLQLSGYFTILPNDSFFFDIGSDGMSPSTINFENWYNVGASGLVKGAYKEAGGQVKMDMRLFLVERGIQAKLNWTPSAVNRADLRNEVHAFANAIIEFYTGNRGIFGTRITFATRTRAGEKHIYVMDVDGAGLRKITDNKGINVLPSFGAGGGIYYTSYKRGNPDLYLWKGGKETLVSSKPGQNSGASYCRGKLALTLSQGGSNADIYLIHPTTGKIQKRLTDHWGIDTSPSWSPDCKKIAFVSDRSGTPQIYVMNADGSDQRRLTFQGRYNTTPDWSPKGNEIAFCGRDERNQFDIFTVDLEGQITRLTQNQGSNEEPSYSPDGNYIVFISSRGGAGSRIYIMTADGQSQNMITSQGGGFSTPSWGGR